MAYTRGRCLLAHSQECTWTQGGRESVYTARLFRSQECVRMLASTKSDHVRDRVPHTQYYAQKTPATMLPLHLPHLLCYYPYRYHRSHTYCYHSVTPATMPLLPLCSRYRYVPATTLLPMCITVYRFSKTLIVYLLPTICILIEYSASKLQRTLVCLLVNNKRTQGVSPAFILFLNKHLLSKEVDISISRMCFNPRKHYFH